MIFTKADRERAERIEKLLTGMDGRAEFEYRSIAKWSKGTTDFLNELGAAVGRIDATQTRQFGEILKFFEGCEIRLRKQLETHDKAQDVQHLDFHKRLGQLQTDFDQWPQWRNGIEKRLDLIVQTQQGTSMNWGALHGRLNKLEENIKAKLCPVCAALPKDINPTTARLAMRICAKMRKGQQTDVDVDWTEDQIIKYLNYAMRSLPKPRPAKKRKAKNELEELAKKFANDPLLYGKFKKGKGKRK